MSFPYVIDGARRLVTVRLPAVVHGRDVRETLQAIYRDADWKSGFNVLWDGTGIGELFLEKDDLGSFVALQRTYANIAGPGHDVTLISRPLDEAMANMYTVMMKNESRTSHVCRSRSEAMKILASKGSESI